jgi:hypothetical protein
MKKIIFVLIFLGILSPVFAFSQSYGSQHDKVVKLFQGNEEPTAKDAVWT